MISSLLAVRLTSLTSSSLVSLKKDDLVTSVTVL